MWLILALSSAVFAGFVSVLGKRGMAGVSSNAATAIRSGVALVLSWLLAVASGAAAYLPELSPWVLAILVVSGLTTGASWLMYFKALKLGRVAQVIAIDRTSLLFTVIFAMVFLGETQNIILKVAGLGLVVAGTCVLVWKKGLLNGTGFDWLPWAIGSMAFAVATTILTKVALSDVDSTLATALRTAVVVIFALGIALAKGERIKATSRRDLWWLVLSGLATGASWLCYFGALKLGEVSLVAPIDKLSIVFAALLAFLFLKERATRRELLGLVIMVVGTIVLIL